LVALTLAFVALVLDQADIKSPVLVWVFGILACVTGLGALAVFIIALLGSHAERSRAQIRVLRRYLWLVGVPLGFGLLVGGMEWLISTSPYNALGIGATAYALAQLGYAVWVVRAARLRNQINELTADVDKLTKQNQELRNQRDWQIRVRCRKLADGLDRLLKGLDRHDPTNKQALWNYRSEYQSEATRLINDLKNLDLWMPESDDPEYLERPEHRKDVQNLYDYLRWVYLGFPK
jgi:hypothetical protein